MTAKFAPAGISIKTSTTVNCRWYPPTTTWTRQSLRWCPCTVSLPLTLKPLSDS